MDTILGSFATAQKIKNGHLLASSLTPAAPATNPGLLYAIRKSANYQSITSDVSYATIYNSELGLPKALANAWLQIYVAYWRCICDVLAAEEEAAKSVQTGAGLGPRELDEVAKRWATAYNSWKEVVNALIRGYSSQQLDAWTVTCLYVAGKYLRAFAIKADDATAVARATGGMSSQLANGGFSEDVTDDAAAENENLEDAARQINRIFGLCQSDRAPLEDSRKWALYYTANLLFKTYFRLNSLSLTKNILRSLSAGSSDLPPLSAFPKAHRVTFHYYHGVILFLSEDYSAAEEALTSALRLAPRATPSSAPATVKNNYLIMTYLIPCQLLTSQKLPSKELLATNPSLTRLFGPVCAAIRAGNLQAFDAALAAGETEFVRRRIYLTLERGRDVCLRNVLRKVLRAAGWEEGQEGRVRRSRIRIEEFVAGVRLAEGRAGSADAALERDEVECLLANAISKNFMKGYIARGPGIVVLSKGGAFPGTGL